MSKLHPVVFKYTCGHEAHSFSNVGKLVQHMDHPCDVCSGRLRRILREHTDKEARKF